MPIDDLNVRQNFPTLPLDPKDPARFSQLTEVAKDAFQVELQRFFDFNSKYFTLRKGETPTIEKYNLGFKPTDEPIETFTKIIRQHPDVLEHLPLVAITTAGGSNLKLGFGSQFVAATQMPARLKGANTGPFALVDGDKIAFQTKPDGKNPVITTILFKSQLFSNIATATIEEVVAVIAVQALYVTPRKTQYVEPIGVLRVDAIGYLAQAYPNEITVLGAPYSTTNALQQLGFVAGVTDFCTNRPPANRYQQAANLTVGIDLGAESENERTELSDLVNNWLSLVMDERDYTMYGRTVFEDDFRLDDGGSENYQIIMLDRHSISGDSELPRQPGSGEAKDLIYVNRITVPITIIDYVDRSVVTPPRTLDQASIKNSPTDSDGLPAGDYINSGETSKP
jgi:hypothetical protein